MTNEAYKHLFESAISALAAIDRELGLPDDGCNATALTIAEIQRLKKLAAISNAAAKAETAAAVAQERERASVLYDMLLNRPALNAGLESEYAAWTSKCYQVTGAYKAAIRAGAKEPSDG